MLLFFLLLTASIIATEPLPSLGERLFSPPERSGVFSTNKILSFSAFPAKSFSTFSYSHKPTTLFHQNFPFKKKKIKSFLWWKNSADAHTLQALSKKVFPLHPKKSIIMENMPSFNSLKTKITKKFILSNPHFSRERKLSSLPSFSSAPALDLLFEKMNKKMSLNDIRELLNRPR